ncbi:MAG: ABC transporter permease [candidate division KSB1 bacterium]|nr:ABC transporter permease [candidate division KSB1 bacterium]MDZ7336473.1 ABC transporter permease [candidate division KSB1 bacterium]MDZ7357252.1 ABC transporter permease [candidate division KSB1 bacterium]MDZ7402120.1 ABC transporter permease [candidate division KSB1 bacterium]
MLRISNLLKAAFNSILKNKLRSILTALGIIIGVASVIVMIAIGKGASARIQAQITSLGTDMLMIRPSFTVRGGVNLGAGSFNRLTFDDVEKIKEQATLIKAISPMVRSGGQVIGGGKNWNTSIYGVSPDYLYIRNYELKSGEMFTERDERSSKKVAVLGKTVAEELFGDQDPVGEQIRINKTPFTVIGVLKEKGQSGMGGDQDDVVLAPSKTVLYRLKGGQYIDMIYVSAISKDQIYAAQTELTTIMRAAHRLQEGEDNDFDIRNQADIISMASSTSKTLTILLGSIAAVSLIVGGIGIMNIMLVSVTERTREIGIRLAVGARSSDILTQFLSESIVLSLIGGIIGTLLAFVVTFLMRKFTTFTPQIYPATVLLAFSFSAIVGVFFGFYPARKAAMLNPIEALRYE